jgi:Xaa-Pro dipeptidase
MNLAEIQGALREEGLDGWLFFDHHRRDPLAYRVLKFTPNSIVSRRWYYFVPAHGEPVGLVHKIEAQTLSELPGAMSTYASWNEMVDGIRSLLAGAKRIAMQYSHNCAVPYVAMVDAGTIELVRAIGVEIATSANLVQYFEARWSKAQLEQHLEAGRRVDRVRREAFTRIGEKLRASEQVTEWDIQQFIARRFREEGLAADHDPDVAVNANASNPHYAPKQHSSSNIKPGDIVLIDMWAKLDQPGAVFYDITWTGYCGAEPPSAIQNVFEVVRTARDRAVERVQTAISKNENIHGFDVDDAARGYIKEKGFADYFVHRTGHSIGEEVHGTGANMDNLETHDERKIIPGTCFSVEPGVYLSEFGIRSEVNVYVGEGTARVTGEKQQELVAIL